MEARDSTHGPPLVYWRIPQAFISKVCRYHLEGNLPPERFACAFFSSAVAARFRHFGANFNSLADDTRPRESRFGASNFNQQSERKVRSRERLGGLLRFYDREARMSILTSRATARS